MGIQTSDQPVSCVESAVGQLLRVEIIGEVIKGELPQRPRILGEDIQRSVVEFQGPAPLALIPLADPLLHVAIAFRFDLRSDIAIPIFRGFEPQRFSRNSTGAPSKS
jgi:hypothetical protein